MIYSQPTPAIALLTPQPYLQTGSCRPYNWARSQAKCPSLLEGVNVAPSVTAGTNCMPRQQQRMEDLERENARLKNELLSANEQIAQLRILNESHAMQIRQLKEKKNTTKC